MKKRILSIVLCVCLLVTGLPVAFAEEVGRTIESAAAEAEFTPAEPSPEELPPEELPPEEPPTEEAPTEPEVQPEATAPSEDAPGEAAELSLEALADVFAGEAFAVEYRYTGGGELRFLWQRLDESAVEEGMSEEETELLWTDLAEGETLPTEANWPSDARFRCVVTDGELRAVSNPARVLPIEEEPDAGDAEGEPAEDSPEEEPEAQLSISVSATEGGFLALAQYSGSGELTYGWEYQDGDQWLALDGAATEALVAAEAVPGCAHRAWVTDGSLTAVSNEAWLPEAVELAAPMAAASGECGDDLTWELSEDGTLTISGSGAMWDYNDSGNVPWRKLTVNRVSFDDRVTSIGQYAFNNLSSLTEVEFPANLTSIGFGAFDGCKGLTELNLPGGLKSIGKFAFERCTGLTELVLPEGLVELELAAFQYCDGLETVRLPGSLASIGESAFYSCGGLTTVEFSEGLTEIQQQAFRYCRKLASVKLPSSLTTLGAYAFRSCYQLATLELPEGLTTIGEYVFAECTSLNPLKLPEKLKRIEEGAFYACTNLESLELPDGLEYIGESAFLSCRGLTSLRIPKSSIQIGKRAFGQCTGITSLELPADLTRVWDGAFESCSGLLELNLPSGLQSIGKGAFNGCSGLRELVLPESLTSLEEGAFQGCYGLQTVRFPSGLTSIPDRAFSGCKGLTELNLPVGLTSIGSGAFENCQGLTELNIPDSVTSIGTSAFYYCTGLKSVRLSEGLTNLGVEAFMYCTSLLTVDIPASLAGEGAVIGRSVFYECSSLTSANLPDGLTIIPGWMFYGCRALTQVRVPTSVREIQERAFADCESLEAIDLPEGLTSIGAYAFNSCKRLERVSIPQTITSIEEGAFYNCTGMTEINLPEGLTSIGEQAFYSCDALTELTLPASLTDIGKGAFESCEGLVELNIPDSMTSLGDSAFYRCSSLREVRLPESMTTIDSSAFSGCTGLTRVDFPEGLTTIKGSAFSGCTSLTSVDFPEGLTTIGDYAFSSCAGLTELKLPDGMTSISSWAFSFCSGLLELHLPENLTTIGQNAFRECTSLTSVTFPEGLTRIDRAAFLSCSKLANVDFPEHMREIGSYVFYMCGFPGIVELPELDTLGSSAFEYCSKLVGVVIQDGLKRLDYGTFSECESLEAVVVPESVEYISDNCFNNCSKLLTLYVMPDSCAEQWAAENGINIEYGSSFELSRVIRVSFAEGIDQSALIGAKLEARSGTRSLELALDGRESYAFDVAVGSPFTVTLRNAYGDALFEREFAPEETEVAVDSVAPCSNFTPSASIDGESIEGKFSLRWTREDGAFYAEADKLYCVPDGTALNAEFVLNAEIGPVYKAPAPFTWTAGVDPGLRRFELQPFVQRTISGAVVYDGAPVAEAEITLSHMLNGAYPASFTAATDGEGRFQVSAYDAPAELRVAAYGYETKTIQLAEDGEPGTIELEKSSGAQVVLRAQVRSAVRAGEAASFRELTNLEGIYFEVYDITAQADLGIARLSDMVLTLPGSAREGSEVRLTARDANGRYASASVELSIVPDERLEADLALVELGGVELTLAQSAASARALLYGADGALAQTRVVEPGASLFSNLPDGAYAVVLMEDSALIGAPASLSALDEFGMAAGTDYVRADVTVSEGFIAECAFDAVPELDETRYCYTDPDASYLSAIKSSVAQGSSFSLRAAAAFQPGYAERASNVRWIFDLPGSSEYYPGTLSVEGMDDLAFTLSGSQLEVPVDDPSRVVRFCAYATQEGELRPAAYLRFDMDGRTITQPVGSVLITVGGLSIELPEYVNTPSVLASGKAPANSHVALYDNGTLVGETEAKLNGRWTLEFELYKPYALSTHQIYAEITMPSGAKLRTRTSELQYQYTPDPARPSRVTMYCNGQELVFDLLHPENSIGGSYYFASSFTFVIEFEGGDLSKLSDVQLEVELSDGGTRTLDAVFDAEKNYFVAADHFDQLEAPVNVSVSYNYDSELYYSQQEIDDLLARIQEIWEEPDTEDEPDEDPVPGFLAQKPVDKLSKDDFEEDYTDEDLKRLQEFNDAVDELNAALAEAQRAAKDFADWRTDCEELNQDVQDFFGNVEADGNSVRMSGGAVEFEARTEVLQDHVELNSDDYSVYMSDDGSGSILVPKDPGGDGPSASGDVYIPPEPPQLGPDGYYDLPPGTQHTEVETHTNESPKSILDVLKGYRDEAEELVSAGNFATNEGVYELYKRKAEILDALGDGLIESKRGKPITDKVVKRLNQAAECKARSEIMLKSLKHLEKLKLAGKILGGIGMAFNVLDLADNWEYLIELEGDNSELAESLKWDLRLQQILLGVALAASAFCIFATGPLGIIIAGLIDFIIGLINSWWLDNRIDQKKKALKNKHAGAAGIPQYDPSGYIYEAVASNRLAGATASCYQRRTEEDIYGEPHEIIELWDAGPYDQINPQITAADGTYAWDVPDGEWQVRVELEGYESAQSDWLPVPPPQLDVNIGLISRAAPELEEVNAAPEAVEFSFNKYMQTEDFADAVTLNAGGMEIEGALEWIDAEANPENPEEYFGRSARFVPDEPLDIGANVEIRVSTDARSYANVAPAGELRMSDVVEALPEALYANENVTLAYGGSGEITLRAEPAEAASGRRVDVQALSDVMLELEETSVTLDEQGCATVHLRANLPGETTVSFALQGTRLSAQTLVQIGMPCDHPYLQEEEELTPDYYNDSGDGLTHEENGWRVVRMYCPDCKQYVEGEFDGVNYPYTEPYERIEDHAGEDGSCARCGAELHVRKIGAENLEIGLKETRALGAVALPLGSPEELSCTSSNKKVVSVEPDGTITGLKKGSAKITIKCGGLSKKITVKVKPAPKSLSLNATKLALGLDEVYALEAKPSKGTASAIRWTSSNPDVLRVEDGVLRPRALGFAAVTAETFNGLTASCSVTVKGAPKAISASKRELTLSVGMTERLSASFEPENAAGTVRYTSADSKRVSVSESGELKALKVTKAPVAITMESYNGRRDVCYVTVVKAPIKVKLSRKKADLGVGDVLRLSATPSPAETVTALNWKTSNAKVATVSPSGLVTALKPGKVKILARTGNGKSASCSITIKAAPGSIELSEARRELGVGESFRLEAKLPKKSAASVSWSSSNSCVSVDADGNVTAERAGSAVITGTTHNGVSANCVVDVKPAPRALILDAHELTVTAGKSVDAPGWSFDPDGAVGAVRFESENTKYVKILPNGKIKGVKATSSPVRVVATSYNGRTDVLYVTVAKKGKK